MIAIIPLEALCLEGPGSRWVRVFLFTFQWISSSMNRVLFFIDGFNVYHALQEKPQYHKYKWLDYSALAN